MCAFKSTPTRQRATREYEFVQRLGKGTFGKVYLANVKGELKKMVAIKLCDASTSERELFMLNTIKKSVIQSKFVAGHSDSYVRGTKLFIVMEWMKMTLWEVIHKEEGKMSLHAIRVVSKQILLGLSALHSMGIIHNDLKPNNVMLVDHIKYPYQLKIIDFGGSVHPNFKGGAAENRPSQSYIAPESNINSIVSPKSDIWAHACIVLEMIFTKRFFRAQSPMETTYQHVQLMGNPSLKFWKMMKNRFMAHFKFNRGMAPIFNDKEKTKARKDSQPETFEAIHKHLLAEGRNEKDVECLNELLKRMLTWNPKDRISVDDALEIDFLNPERFEDKQYAEEAKEYFKKSKL